jgi:putative FmdB family regulatory protein
VPIYSLKCPACGHAHETFASMRQRDAITCPQCQAKGQETNWATTRIRNGNRVFHGQETESVIHFVPKKDVKYFRQAYGQAGNCIRDDGSVVFSDRQEERRFVKAKQQHDAEVAAQQTPDPDTMHADGEGRRTVRRRALRPEYMQPDPT